MKKLLLLIFVMFSLLSISQITTKEYIDKYTDIAIEEMNLYKIPASITLAQGVVETNSGNGELAINTNNHFGIKCKKNWKGKTYLYDDDAENECFRVYNSVDESYRDHSEFLAKRRYYKNLFKLELNDYKGWAYGLKEAGYATNPKYPELLIKVIEEYELYKLDSEYGN